MDGWVDGCLGDSFWKYYHFVGPSCKLELSRLSALLRIHDGAKCGNLSLLIVKKFLKPNWYT